MKPNHFKENYDCAEPDLCYDCYWFNGEQCIRQLLTEGDIMEHEKKIKEKKKKIKDKLNKVQQDDLNKDNEDSLNKEQDTLSK